MIPPKKQTVRVYRKRSSFSAHPNRADSQADETDKYLTNRVFMDLLRNFIDTKVNAHSVRLKKYIFKC